MKLDLALGVLLGAASFVTAGPSGPAREELRFTAPTGESAYSPGDRAQVRWTGGDPGWRMRLDIIDTQRRAVVDGSVVEDLPNSGAARLPIPAGLPCGRRYQFYVEEMSKVAWAYGGTFTLACDDEAAQPTPAAAPAPAGEDGGAPNPGAGPMPTPPPSPPTPKPTPPAPPAPLMTSPQKLCGRIHNETYNLSDSVIITLNPGGGFSGNLNIGASLYGSGPFKGSNTGGQCRGATSQLSFQGTCSADHVTARYSINGQVGTMELTAAACPGAAQPPAPPPPGPAAPGAPAAPAAPPAPAARMCGTVHNETYNLSDTVTITLSPTDPNSGYLTIGSKLYGSGAFRFTQAGGQCSASTGALTMKGACPTDHYSARYLINGQVGTIDVSGANCH